MKTPFKYKFLRKKTFITFLLITLSTVVSAQGYQIFQAQGDCQILLKGKAYPCSELRVFQKSNTIKINKGWITLLDGDMKRLTITKSGRYEFRQIQQGFEKQNASKENKFFALLLEMMRKKEMSLVDMPGASIRGESNHFFGGPLFGDTVISERLNFQFPDKNFTPIEFLLYDEFNNILVQIDYMENELIIPIQRDWGYGTFKWEILFEDKSIHSIFFIPDDPQKNEKAAMLEEFTKSIDDFPSDTQPILINSFKHIHKLY